MVSLYAHLRPRIPSLPHISKLKNGECVRRRADQARVVQGSGSHHEGISLLVSAIHSKSTEIPELADRHPEETEEILVKNCKLSAILVRF